MEGGKVKVIQNGCLQHGSASNEHEIVAVIWRDEIDRRMSGLEESSALARANWLGRHGEMVLEMLEYGE